MESAAKSLSSGHQAALDVLLLLAEGDARSRDYRGAVQLLDHAAEAGHGLPIEYQLKRHRWTRMGYVRYGSRGVKNS
jgi:hypothetical protein